MIDLIPSHEPKEVSVKEVYISKTERQYLGFKFLIDGVETERYLEADSLWKAIQEYVQNHFVFPKTIKGNN